MEQISQGNTHEHEFSFTQEEVKLFAKVTGDSNPLHLDSEYAANTPFKKPIMHGILSASIFSKVLGTIFPGEGTVYLSQKVDFLRPMFVEVKYKAVFEVKSINPDKHTAVISTSIYQIDTNKITVRGEAGVMHRELIG
ncbi:MaoC family dehydratase [Flammeovirgaceae bacterium SG7u.111]|nr:MaoC family dehydratase [Flammeovirgaceae bacterium SG7u.132]WPO35988.1 MaoC family dehydratase [Flammeovirgaceae bacterium SG7u.111]